MSQVPSATRELVRERDRGMCQRHALARPAQELQHRRARGMGSAERDHTHCPCNLVWLCSDCHRTVESERTQARLDGYAVSIHVGNPSLYPITMRGKRSYLTCLGKVVPA